MRKKNLKRIIVASLFLSVLVASTGCGKADYSQDVENVLKEKYEEDFTLTSKPARDGDLYHFTAYANDYADLIFTGDFDEDLGAVSDNYVQHRVADSLVKDFAMTDTFVETGFSGENSFFVYAVPTTEYILPTSPNITAEDFQIENPDNEFAVYVYVDENKTSERQIYTYASGFAKENPGIDGFVRAYITDADTIGKIEDYFSENDMEINEYKDLSKDAKENSIDFSNGTLSETEEEFVKGFISYWGNKK